MLGKRKFEQQAVRFNSKSKEARQLSNFYESEVVVRNVAYPSGEHAFHGLKFAAAARVAMSRNQARAEMLRKQSDKFAVPSALATALDAKRQGGKKACALQPEEIADWLLTSCDAQAEICKAKLLNTSVSETLYATGSALLVHQDNRAKASTIWGARISKEDGSLIGQNKLGEMWTTARENL